MGIKKVKLEYKPVAKRKINEIAYVVNSEYVKAVNRSIKQNLLHFLKYLHQHFL